MQTLNVGSHSQYKNLPAALAAAHDGDTILLEPETFDLGTSSLTIKQNNLTITTLQKATVMYSAPPTATFFPSAITVQGANVLINGLTFLTTKAWTITAGKWMSNLRIGNCDFTGPYLGFDGVQLMNAKQVTIFGCTFGTTQHYGVYSGGLASERMNTLLAITNCVFMGSGEHCVRTHYLDGLTIDGCTVHNEWDRFNNYHGGALNIRDGKNVTIRNTITYGSFGVGPLPISPPETYLDNVTITNCKMFGSYFNLCQNVRNLNINGLELHADQSGNAFNVAGGPKSSPTGTVTNVQWEYTGGSTGFFSKNQTATISWSNITKFGVIPNQAEIDRLTAEIAKLEAQLAADKAALFKLNGAV